MGLESATHINGLNATNPTGTDPKSQGDDHIRLLKSTILASFPAIAGAMNASHTELNYSVGVTSAIQTQLDGKAASSHAHSAADLTSGTIPDARFPATLPAASGVNLTALVATQLTSGTLPDARLSANVPLKNAANTFTTAQLISDNTANPALTVNTSSASFSPRISLISSAGAWVLYINAGATALGFYDGTADRLVISNGGNFDFKAGAVTTDNASASEVGYKGMPRNAQNAGYTLALTDCGKHVYMQTAGTFTIPANASVAFPVGTVITLVNLSGSNCTVAITTDTLQLAGTSTTGSRTLANAGIATIIKTDANRWLVSGPGVS